MQAQSVQELHTEKLIKNHYNVCGTGIGKKWVDGKPTRQNAILIFVEKKLTKSNVFSKFSVGEMVPSMIDGIPTDIIEVGKLVKQTYKKKIRPLCPGYSCGHGGTTAGTMGGFFYDKDGTPVILSNNHVVGNENAAKIGDPIYQPGPLDTRGTRESIGRLKKFMKLSKNNNTHDSGIVEIDPALINSNLINPIYPVINQAAAGFGNPATNMQVQKCGRTTGYTTGRVIGLNSTFSIEYDFGEARFNKCVVITAMSQGGDSGSIIYDMQMNAVGLLFAGSNKVTLANPFDLVKDYYGLKIWDAPPVETITIDSNKWQLFTTDGSITKSRGKLKLIDNANHHCFVEHQLTKNVKSVSCTVNTGSDQGATWGPGLVLQFPTGMIKVNLRHNGEFGGYFNTQFFLNVGKTKPNTNYTLRIRKHRNTWIGEVNDKGKWFTAMQIPDSVFPAGPTAVRIGKTGILGSTTDHSQPKTKGAGAVGECTISNLEIQ